MSAFEIAVWNWYCETVTPFTMESGIVAEMHRALGLSGMAQTFFIRAAHEIHQMFSLLEADRKKRAKG